MAEFNGLDKKQRRVSVIVLLYPIAVFIVGLLLNYFVLGVNPIAAALPSPEGMRAAVIAAVVLLINHTWIMTSTELVRIRFKMYATPEEWAASGSSEKDAPEQGMRELKRRHNAHRNTTENVVYFVFLSCLFVLSSPSTAAVQVWIIGFAIARLGYTYSYLSAKDPVRGLFMTLGLLATYGIAGNLLLSVFI